MFMSIFTDAARVDDPGLRALSWTALPVIGDAHPAGQAQLDVRAGADLVFVLSPRPLHRAREAQGIDWPDGTAILRIDEVCFPAGAVTVRHTHAGAGFRHLMRGALDIEMAGTTETIEPRDTWFEPVDTPVRAAAMYQQGITSLVRCMVLPLAFAGKSTFRAVRAEDADVPQMQMIHRHLEVPIKIGP